MNERDARDNVRPIGNVDRLPRMLEPDPPSSAAGGSIGVDSEMEARRISGLVDAPEMPVSLAAIEEPLRLGGIELGDLSDAELANLGLRLAASIEFSAFQWARTTSLLRNLRPRFRL